MYVLVAQPSVNFSDTRGLTVLTDYELEWCGTFHLMAVESNNVYASYKYGVNDNGKKCHVSCNNLTIQYAVLAVFYYKIVHTIV